MLLDSVLDTTLNATLGATVCYNVAKKKIDAMLMNTTCIVPA